MTALSVRTWKPASPTRVVDDGTLSPTWNLKLKPAAAAPAPGTVPQCERRKVSEHREHAPKKQGGGMVPVELPGVLLVLYSALGGRMHWCQCPERPAGAGRGAGVSLNATATRPVLCHVPTGQVRFITRPKSRTMRATRQLMLPPITVS